jgi:hypothetical protein
MMSALVGYKTKKLSRKKLAAQTLLWLVILLGLILAKPLYEFLFSNKLTDTEPLSLFDVIQITAIIFLMYSAYRARLKVENLNRKLQDLHQELSILLSETENTNRKVK